MKNNKPELIVMLTHHDRTVANAPEIFETCRETKAKYWGFKEEGLPIDKMKRLYADMKACGKKTGLEVVAYTEKEGLDGARMAAECGVDYLLGTLYFDSVLEFCREQGLCYVPFIGEVTERPSVLNGTAEGMIREAREYLQKGVYGIDLLGYRYTGDGAALNREVVSRLDAPVCVAGSVNSWERLDEIRSVSPWSFTIGGGFFENRFGGSFAEQVDKVYDYVMR
ncbi:MAG: hypothetical protein IJ899_15985 [Blautia sp.]|nr:hypothetical protein [Blautia sp.]